ncbi:3-phosphoshikimate 1-carboxyvinyltransferase [uncultured archaeon]|nr:3-phosphoshikimate 1-carboxyvinyltransferase [uncultured archaeon]
MVLATLRRSTLSGVGRPPPSVPVARRLLWAACTSEGGVIGRLPDHPDIAALLEAGRELGAEAVVENGVADIFGPNVPVPPETLSCASNAAVSRFSAPLSLLTLQPPVLTGLRIPDSASRWLDGAASSLGVRLIHTSSRLEVHGVPEGDALSLEDRAGAFWAPGLMLAAPLSNIPLMLAMDEYAARHPSVQLTLRMLERLRMDFSWEEQGPTLFMVPGQTYPELNVEVESDWRAGSYLLGALLLAGRGAAVLERDSVQPERGFWLPFESAGQARWNEAEDSIWAQAGEAPALPAELDMRPYPSLYPLALVLATQAAAPVRFTPLYPLSPLSRHRLIFTAQQLQRLGADIQIEQGAVEVRPSALAGGEVSSGGDSRIAMGLALAGLICEHSVSISGAEAAARAYPNFWADLQALGAQLEMDYTQAPAMRSIMSEENAPDAEKP